VLTEGALHQLETRHRPGWHPASDPVVGLRTHAPDVYKGRDYAALTEAAKRKPRTEDDVLRG